jgi:hypothetical protein
MEEWRQDTSCLFRCEDYKNKTTTTKTRTGFIVNYKEISKWEFGLFLDTTAEFAWVLNQTKYTIL